MPLRREIAETELLDLCHRLIAVRWVAAAALTAALAANEAFFRAQSHTLPLWVVTACVAAYNAGFVIYARRRLMFCLIGPSPRMARLLWRFAGVQIALDAFALAALIRYSGGIESPLALICIAQVAFAGVLLGSAAGFALAALMTALYGAVTVGEATGLFGTHYGFLSGLTTQTGLYGDKAFVAGWLAGFAGALFASAYAAGVVADRRLRRETALMEKTAALAQANRLLEGLERRKSQFLLVAAHQLKSPLLAIVNLLEVVRGGQAPPEKRDEFLGRAQARATSAARQVEDLLQLSRLRELTPERQRWQVMDFGDVVKAACAAAATQADAKSQKFEQSLPELPARVEGDSESLFDATLNLVENAVKYTDPRGEIRVTLRAAGGGWELAVKDTGCGIPEAEMKHVFQEFFRASNATKRRIEGTGLGLSIVQRIVEMHKGRVGVESREGVGSTFTAWLPGAP